MDDQRFKEMVAQLERESAVSPRSYRLRVAALALLGFGILALLMLAIGGGLALLVGFVIAVVLTGGKLLLLLVKLGKLLVLLAIPLWYVLAASVRALLVRLPAPEGREISRAEAPALFAAIDDMRARMRGPQVHHVLIVDEVNAAVMQRPAFGLVGWPRNYLILGLPLLESMLPSEALAVTAHEYGHLAGSHSRFSAYIYRLRNTWGAIQSVVDQIQGWLGKLISPLVRWYAPYFNAYTFVLARADEYQADAASAELVGATHAAHALKRVNVVAPRHQRFLEQTFDRIGDDAEPPADLLQRWAAEAMQPPIEADAARWLADALDREGHYADTHPTLRHRLAALPDIGEPLQQPPPPVEAETAAVRWLGALLAPLRLEFQRQWQQRVAEPWAERHAYTQQQRQALAQLRALPERDAQQQLDYLQHVQRLEPNTDLRAALAAYNTAHAGNALAMFLEGVELLKRGDRLGLGLFEDVMARDPDAIKPACEHAHQFLLAHKESEAAEAYAERWRARDAVEAQQAHELHNLHVTHVLVPHELGVDVLAPVLPAVQAATRRYVSAVYLARRILPSDPTALTYVVAIDVSWLGNRLERANKLRDTVAAIEWPMHVLVCTLDGDAAALKKHFVGMAGARIV